MMSRLLLQGRAELVLLPQDEPQAGEDEVVLTVLCCGICPQ
jgi:D-arabinose 1-dehydrogenase-like Zn-dependent alcohol dehydrogenase